jgi:serine/threonine protein kinase
MSEAMRKVGRFEILRRIGKGGAGIVYLARQVDLDREVALKELAPFHAGDPIQASRFLRESRVAASLAHPNVVAVHDYFQSDGVPYIAMEYLERGSLRPFVRNVTVAQAVGALEGILAGLAHAESHGVVHRDLKPENVMLAAGGTVKIADFGIAKALTQAGTAQHLTATGTTVGTPAYMAPEQAMGRPVGPWTDLYSTGIVAYEMLVGRLPFGAGDTPLAILLRHVNEPLPSPRALNPDLDPRIAEWLERLLAKEPERRTRSAAEAWDALEDAAIAVLGPRWRREARLAPQPSAGALAPLSPARFPAPAGESSVISTRPPATDAGGASTRAPRTDAPRGPRRASTTGAPRGPRRASTTGAPRGPTRAPTTDAGRASTYSPATEAPGASTDAPTAGTAEGFGRRARVARAGASAPLPPQPWPRGGPPSPPPPPATDTTTGPAPSVARPAGRPSAGARRAWALLLAVLAVVAAGAAGWVAGRPGAREASPPERLSSTSNGDLEVSYGDGWRRARPAAPPPGLRMDDPLALVPAGAGKEAGQLTAGRTRATGPCLLPRAFVDRLRRPARCDDGVRLGRLEARRHRDLRPKGAEGRVTVYAVPTSRGVATVACEGRAGARGGRACERVASTLDVSGRPFSLGPQPAHARRLAVAMGALNRGRTADRARLRRATTPRGQARWALRLARHSAGARNTLLAYRAVSPADRDAHDGLVRALGRAREGYAGMVEAARRGDASAWRRGRAAVHRAEDGIRRALSAFDRNGYRIR